MLILNSKHQQIVLFLGDVATSGLLHAHIWRLRAHMYLTWKIVTSRMLKTWDNNDTIFWRSRGTCSLINLPFISPMKDANVGSSVWTTLTLLIKLHCTPCLNFNRCIKQLTVYCLHTKTREKVQHSSLCSHPWVGVVNSFKLFCMTKFFYI